MRPLELDLTAFRSYDRETVDLRPHDLVVITGDTGAGKTSLLDAICFALFGRAPGAGRSGDLLTLGRRNGEVRLTFVARGETWRVTRRYGPDAPDPALLAERLEHDGGPVAESRSGEAASERIGGVVGMSYKAFTSAVLLAQGAFDAFLSARPADRDAILRELFGVASLDGARQAALRAQEAAATEAALREGDAAAQPAHDARRRAAAARAARDAAVRHALARSLRPAAERLARLRDEEAAARERAASARRGAEDLPSAEEADALAARLAAARAAAADGERRRAGAAERAAAAAAALEGLRARLGGGAGELAALCERAERGAALDAELPDREEALAGREEALAARRERLAALGRDMDAMAAEADRLGRRDAALARHAEAVAAAERAGERLAAAEAELEAATAARRTADEACREADEAHRAAEREDLAATLRAGLAPGDACPVCGGEVGAHPVHAAPADGTGERLARARATAETAAGTWAQAQERVRAARESATAHEAALAREREALEAAGIAPAPPPDPREAQGRAEALARALDGLREEERETTAEAGRCEAERERLASDRAGREADRRRLGAWAQRDHPVAALRAAMAEVAEAEGAAAAAAGESAAAAERAARCEREAAAIEGGPVAGLRAAAARVAARGGLEAPGDDLPAGDLVAAVGRLRERVLRAERRHRRAAEAAAAEAASAERGLRAAGAPLGVAGPADVGPALRAAEGARDAARAALATLDEAAARARALRAQAATARERARVHGQVALDLKANGFPRYLLGRYRERLAVGASARLQELTGGAFRLDAEGTDPMAVIDRGRGEARRPASTLSGGERFLASLALALGLSEVAAESGGRLDCLFLDEGFSTLDAESLEQALAGVERLAGDGRLVAVITHLPGVADRLGAAIHVRKDAEGTSRVVEPATPDRGPAPPLGAPVMVAP